MAVEVTVVVHEVDVAEDPQTAGECQMATTRREEEETHLTQLDEGVVVTVTIHVVEVAEVNLHVLTLRCL